MNILSPSLTRSVSASKSYYPNQRQPKNNSRNHQNHKSGVNIPGNQYGKTYMTQTSTYNVQQYRPQNNLKKSVVSPDRVFSETSPNFGLQTSPKHIYNGSYPIVRTQPIQRLPPHINMTRVPIKDNRSMVQDKIEYVLAKHQEMKNDVNRLKQVANKQNKAYKNQNQYLQKTLKQFYTENQHLKRQFQENKNQAQQIFKNYQNKLEQNNAYMTEIQKKQQQNYIPRALVEEILNIHQFVLKQNQNMKNIYGNLVQQLNQLKKKQKNQRQLYQSNIQQLLSDINTLKQTVQASERAKVHAQDLKKQFQNLYEEKKKDFETLKELQNHDNAHASKESYERWLNDFQSVSKQRQQKIIKLKVQNQKLEEQISKIKPKSVQKQQNMYEQVRQWEQKCREVEMKMQAEINIRLNLQGKMSLVAIQNQRLRKDLEKYKQSVAEHQIQKNNISVSMNRQHQSDQSLKREIQIKNRKISELQNKLKGIDRVFEQMAQLQRKLTNAQCSKPLNKKFDGLQSIRNQVIDIENGIRQMSMAQGNRVSQIYRVISIKFDQLFRLMGYIEQNMEKSQTQSSHLKNQIHSNTQQLIKQKKYISQTMRSLLSEIDILLAEINLSNSIQYTKSTISKIRQDIKQGFQILQSS